MPVMNFGLKRVLSMLLILSIVTSLVGCGKTKPTVLENGINAVTINENLYDTVGIQDTFVELSVNPIQIMGAEIEQIDPHDITVDPILIKEIQSIEIQQVSINDEFVYLAYQNFVSYYEEDIDVAKLLKDVAIGSTVILVWVTLSTVGGPAGTFFGAVLCSEFTPITLAVGAAIDAAVSGYQAYVDGGDASYIIGYMINGIADGYKWAAFLAPVTGAVAGIKALKAVSKLTEIPALKDITQKEASEVFKNLAEILKKTPNITAEAPDDVISAAFLTLSDSLPKEISEDLFSKIIKNQDTIIALIRQFDPFSVSRDVLSALRTRYCLKAGLTEEAADQFVKKLQNQTYKRISDITEDNMREYVSKNMRDFIEFFGDKLSREFVDNSLEDAFGKEAFQLIKQAIKSKGQYAELITQISVSEFDDMNRLLLLQLRFGATSTRELYAASRLFKQMQLGNNSIPEQDVVQIINGIVNGEIKSLDDVIKINKTIGTNLDATRAILAENINNLGVSVKNAALLDNLATSGLEKIARYDETGKLIERLDYTQIQEIVQQSMSKAEIIDNFGDDVYKMLKEHYYLSIESLALSSSANKELIADIAEDALRNKGLAQSTIDQIIKGEASQFWGLADEQIVEISNIVGDYYKSLNIEIYDNFINDVAEVRGGVINDFIQSNKITIRNSGYAGGIMPPTGDADDLVKLKYGDIYMSTRGFPIFDKYAIARIESDTLTGLGSDLNWANRMYYGKTANIPGYTWHHLEDGRTMILIPTELHDAYRHTGGAALIREGL